MLTELFFIILHLTLFSQIINDLFTPEALSFETKKQNLLLFLLYSCLFYFSFLFHSALEIPFFTLKKLFFSFWTPCVAILLSLVSLFFTGNNLKKIGFILSLTLSPFLFFLVFGIEKFFFPSFNFNGLQLLKAQNPLIGLFLCFLLILKEKKYQWFFFILIITGIGSYNNHRTAFLKKSNPTAHYHIYSPSEFFFEGDYLLSEEENGIYSYSREVEIEEPIFRFTLKPLRNLHRKDRQFTQELISTLDFPILLKEENQITLYDLFRTYRGVCMKLKIGVGGGILSIEGPIF